MAGFHQVVDEALVVEGFFKILIDAVEVGFQDIGDVIWLATDAVG